MQECSSKHRINQKVYLYIRKAEENETPKKRQKGVKMMENAILKAILERRSVRAYTQEMLTEAELDALLKAAIYAPSAMNTQAWHFTVIRDQELLTEVSRAAHVNAGREPDDGHVFYHAPVAILTSAPAGEVVNGALAVENMALAAHGLGLGSVIIGFANMAFSEGKNAELLAKLKLPEGYAPVLWLAVGYPAETPEVKPRAEGTVSYLG